MIITTGCIYQTGLASKAELISETLDRVLQKAVKKVIASNLIITSVSHTITALPDKTFLVVVIISDRTP